MTRRQYEKRKAELLSPYWQGRALGLPLDIPREVLDKVWEVSKERMASFKARTCWCPRCHHAHFVQCYPEEVNSFYCINCLPYIDPFKLPEPNEDLMTEEAEAVEMARWEV